MRRGSRRDTPLRCIGLVFLINRRLIIQILALIYLVLAWQAMASLATLGSALFLSLMAVCFSTGLCQGVDAYDIANIYGRESRRRACSAA